MLCRDGLHLIFVGTDAVIRRIQHALASVLEICSGRLETATQQPATRFVTRPRTYAQVSKCFVSMVGPTTTIHITFHVGAIYNLSEIAYTKLKEFMHILDSLSYM